MSVGLGILIAVGALFLLAFLLSLIFPFNGLWERIESDSQFGPKERIRLAQFGFLVLGRRTVVGGTQRFFGFCFANHVWLSRRDHGVVALKKEGFPEGVARKLDGSVLARYHLRLSGDHNFLHGRFKPYRVEFSLEPEQLTGVYAQPTVERHYQRIELVADREIVTASTSLD